MEKSEFPTEAVRQVLNQMLCVKIDGDKDRKASKQLKVKGYPTLVLFDPQGKELVRIPGKPPSLMESLSVNLWNQAVEKLNREDHRAAVPILLLLSAYFPNTESGTTATGQLANLESQDGTKELVQTKRKEFQAQRALGKAKRTLQIFKDRKTAKELLRKLLEEYPDTPQAQEAKKLLRSLGEKG